MNNFMIEIGHNVAMLLSIALLYQVVRQTFPRARRTGDLLAGVLFGAMAIYCMLTAFVMQSGVIFDGRSIVLALAGLFGSGWSGLVAVVVAAAYRVWLGGPGIWAGLATILVAGTGGVVARRFIQRSNWPPSPLQLWWIGMWVHLLVLACMMFLPATIRFETINNLALPFLLIFPMVTVVLGTIMASGERVSHDLRQLHHSEWLFGQAQQLTRFGSWEYHLAEDRLSVTENFRALLGLPGDQADLSLQDLFGRIHRDDWEAFRLAFDNVIATDDEFDTQGRLVRDDGSEIWIRLVGKAVRSKGKVVVVGNLIDISRRMLNELELRGSEERLQAILDAAPALICICSLEGIVLLHNRYFQVFGVSADAAIGRPLYELLPRGGALEQWVDDLLLLQAGDYVEFEETISHVDGSVHIYLTSKFLLPSSPHREASICYIATDISELRLALADRLKLSEKLREKNEELEQFTYTVSHDLKAPLLTISSYAELLRGDLESGDREQVAEDLSFICAAVEKMRRLIDALLELSRIGRTSGEMSMVALAPVMDEVLLLVSGEIKESNARIEVAPELPAVYGNSLRLQQVMQNLVQNALKFRDPARPLLVEIGWQRETDGAIVVTVRDNGIGIDPARLESVFELFVHGTEAGSGTGIGLAMVRRIMTSFGGVAWAESAGKGTGATICLRFPQGKGGGPAPAFSDREEAP